MPEQGRHGAVELATVLGTLLTLAAIILATLPWPRGAFRRQRPVG